MGVLQDPHTASPFAADRLAALTELGFEPVSPHSDGETGVYPAGRDGFRVESCRPAMTTLVSVTAIHQSRDRAVEAIGRAFEEMDRLIRTLSRFEPSSALSVLNAEGRLDGPPPELAALVSDSLIYHEITRGAFDPTVAPLVNLFQSSADRAAPREPSVAEIAEARSRTGVAGIVASSHRARLTRAGMALTLDGIAKGYIVDRMAAMLERSGVARYVVEAGGDIRTGGLKEGGRPWAIAVRDPDGRGRLPGTLHCSGGAVATSGSYERYYDLARRFHHIVEPTTGTSPQDCVSATVVAPTATAADALATAVMVLGARAGIALVGSLPGCAALVVQSNGRLTHSHGWKESPS
jgi:thiamine biosynthesis lipoprotein